MRKFALSNVLTHGKNFLGKMFGNGAAAEATQRAVAAGMNPQQAAALFQDLGKKSVIGKIIGGTLKGGAILGIADVAINGMRGLVGGLANSAWTDVGKIEAEQNAKGAMHGLFTTIKLVLNALGITNSAIHGWVDKNLQDTAKAPSMYQELVDNPLEFAKNNPVATGATAVVAGAAVGLPVLGAAVSTIRSLVGGSTPPPAIMPGLAGVVPPGGIPASSMSAGATSAVGGFKSFMRKLPGVGKFFGIGAAAVGTGMALMGSANASEDGTPDTSFRDNGVDLAAVGASVVGAGSAAAAMAPVAAGLGIKAIPGIASIYAAGEGIYNTAKHTLKGEWAKAGLSAVSGVGETVAGLGGVLTYTTVGTAWREAVRYGGAKMFGQENTIEHSDVVRLTSWLRDEFSDATATTKVARAPTFHPSAPALALGG